MRALTAHMSATLQDGNAVLGGMSPRRLAS